MDLAPIIARKAERFRELDNAIADPTLFDQPARARATLREHTQLKGLLDGWAARQKARTQRDENVEMSRNETDAELAAMAAEELTALDAELARLDREIQLALLPPDPTRTATPSWKSARAPAAARPRCSPPTCTACTRATWKPSA